MPLFVIRWLVRREQRQLIRILDRLDDRMKAAGTTRAERRQFWRSVIGGHTDLRSAVK